MVSKCIVGFQSINWPAFVRISISTRGNTAIEYSASRIEKDDTTADEISLIEIALEIAIRPEL